MRHMTPDTPSTRMLEPQETEKQKHEMEAVDMTAMTPTPTPKQSPEKTAAASDCASTSVGSHVPQKRRRAIRTYGSKKRTLEDASDSRTKRPKPTTLHASISTVPPASTCGRLMDEVSRQLQNEAAEAERRRCEDKEKENQTHVAAARISDRPVTTSQAARPKTPQTPRKSPRKALGIMRYFQPAAAPRPRTPPALGAACSPTASISSMSSLSSCPSPTSPLSVSSFEVEGGVEEAEDIEERGKDATGVTDPPLSPMVWREQRPRQKRRLTIRPDHAVCSQADAQAEEENEGDNASGDSPTTLASTPIFKAFNGMSSSSRMRMQLGLVQKAAASTSTAKAKKAKTVQTTLSLAIGPSDSGSVRECKECSILYNPLHETDAKFHARYHASVVGKAKKA